MSPRYGLLSREGSTIVVSIPYQMNEQQRVSWSAQLTAKFPGRKIVILDGGATLETIKVEKESKRISFRAMLLARSKP